MNPQSAVYHSPLSASIYQASTLVTELTDLKCRNEYPKEARLISDVFLCFAEYLKDQLEAYFDPKDPQVPKGGSSAIDRIRNLARAVQELYSYVRFIRSAEPNQTPASIGLAFGRLTRTYLQKHDEDALCLVRRQWRYNLDYISLNEALESLASPSVLNLAPEFDLSSQTVIECLWARKYGVGRKPPGHLAVLSFAGLDTDDTLLYALLAH